MIIRILCLFFWVFLIENARGQGGVPAIGGVFGLSNYLGDIGNGIGEGRPFIRDLQPQETRTTVGVYALNRMDRRWGVRYGLQYVGIAGDDIHTNAGPRRARNLHFRNNLIEASVRSEGYLHLNQAFQSGFNIPVFYGFIGLAGFYSNPQAREINTALNVVGVWHNLRPETTEGVRYSPLGVAIPWGIGAQWRLQDGWQLGAEFCYRFTFTDYLDDISTTYSDSEYSSRATEASVAAAGEGAGELTDHVYNPLAPNRRGNPENKDGYFSLQLTFSKASLRGRGSHSWSKKSGFRLRQHPNGWNAPPRR